MTDRADLHLALRPATPAAPSPCPPASPRAPATNPGLRRPAGWARG